MQQLPDQDRRLLELVAVDGLSTGEAARALGITAVATRSAWSAPGPGCAR